MKKAIVTGATGFIGRALARELINNKVEVIAVVRKKSQGIKYALPGMRMVECDISEYDKLPELTTDGDIECVFHTAWQGISDTDAKNQEIQIQNLKGTLDLIESMNTMNIKTFVGCGSMHEAEAFVEISQDKRIDNLGMMYKASKTAAHWMGKAKAGHYGIKFFWPLINAYGEGEKSARLINVVIRNIFQGKSPDLSSGEQFYDFVHVDDVAHALFLIAEKGIDGANYLIGSGEAKPLKEFLRVVGAVANEINGTHIPLGFGRIRNNVISLQKETFDIKNLKRDTGFEISIPFETGIRRTAEWIYRDMRG